MVTTVIKRDGKMVPFNAARIIKAITKSGAVPNRVKYKIAYAIRTNGQTSMSVEDIQNEVERMLAEEGYWDVSRSYVRYRYKRELARGSAGIHGAILSIADMVNQEVLDENSNKNPIMLSTQRDYIAGEVSRDISYKVLFPEDCVTAHKDGIIHIHDTDYFVQHMHNCCVWDAADMLQNGTVINDTLIEKPHSFSTACNIATQIMAIIASCQYGGQTLSIAHLAPFVNVSRQRIRAEVEAELDKVYIRGKGKGDGDKIDKPSLIANITEERLKKEIQRGVQTMQYQVNTISSSNGQTPFVTFWLSLSDCAPGQERDDMAMVIEEILKQRLQGVKNKAGAWVSPAFPKLIYGLSELTMDESSPYFYLTELAAKCSAKRLVPDSISEKLELQMKYPMSKRLPTYKRRDLWGDEHIWGRNPFKLMSDSECAELDAYASGSDDPKVIARGKELMEKYSIPYRKVFPEVYPCMGCRSFLTPDFIHYKHYGRFNQGVVTINLPDVALSAIKEVGKDDKDILFRKFWTIFSDRLNLCHKALRVRHDRLKGTVSDASPIHWQYGALARLNPGEVIDPLLYDNYSTLSLGYAGLYECVYAMTGYSHTDPHAKEFALNIMKAMNEACAQWREDENISYSLYGTPIETTTYKFAQCLQKRFGIVPEVTDHGYITNSYHVNVREHIDPFSKLDFEAEFQALSPGGAISYIETADLTGNTEAVLSVMRHIYDTILYAELNTKSDYCQACGFDGEIKIVRDNDTGRLVWECPNCGNRDQNTLNVARRTCGYIGSKFWNQGRTEEIQDRVVHLGGEE